MLRKARLGIRTNEPTIPTFYSSTIALCTHHFLHIFVIITLMVLTVSSMLTTTRAAGRLTFSHLWPQNHLLRLFSISSLKSGSGWSTDPETRRRQYDKFYAKTRKEYAQNPEAREKKLIQGRAIKAARSGAYQRVLYQRNNFYRWVVSGLRHGFVRSWKTHTPKLDERTDVRLCSGCNMLLRKSLWWKRNNDSEDRYDVCAISAVSF